MTRAGRKREAEFWRGLAAEVEEALYVYCHHNGLCHPTEGHAARTACVQLFRPEEFSDELDAWFWSDCHRPIMDDDPHGRFAPCMGRVVACGFLAAMAEAGDLDEIYDAT